MNDDEPPNALIPLTVSEIRQWTFCPRVVWHRRMMPHRTRETPKMALGRDAQTALERLERRRLGGRYGLDSARRHFDVALTSKRLAARGTCDLVLDSPATPDQLRSVVPVEVKRTQGGASAHHNVQLAGYATLLEETWSLPPNSVDQGFLLLLPEDELIHVPISPVLRTAFEQALHDVRAMLDTERFPDPT